MYRLIVLATCVLPLLGQTVTVDETTLNPENFNDTAQGLSNVLWTTNGSNSNTDSTPQPKPALPSPIGDKSVFPVNTTTKQVLVSNTEAKPVAEEELFLSTSISKQDQSPNVGSETKTQQNQSPNVDSETKPQQNQSPVASSDTKPQQNQSPNADPDTKPHVHQSQNKLTPTVVPVEHFDPRADSEALHNAMKGWGTDEDAIINILAKRTITQRLEITHQYELMFKRDLLEHLKSEISGHFEDLIEAMLTPPEYFYAESLYDLLSCAAAEENCFIEVLSILSNPHIKEIKRTYETRYKSKLDEDLRTKSAGMFDTIMDFICEALANQSLDSRLSDVRFETHESAVKMVVCQHNYDQIPLLYDKTHPEYCGDEVEQLIREKLSGSVQQTLLNVLRCLQDLPRFFSKRLFTSMDGMGTKNRQLIRTIVSRSEVDMGEIKVNYAADYGKTLAFDIKRDTSGDYRTCLLALIGEH